MLDNKLQVEIKSVYGTSLVYPVCDKAQLFAKLIAKKTFPKHVIDILQELGYELDIISKPFEGIA